MPLAKREPKVDKELKRARQIAALEYKEFKSDPTRCFTLRAIEVRLDGTSHPDVSLHAGSGVRTQGGYLFFIEDLEDAVGKQQTL